MIDHDEAHVLVLDATGMLQRVAATGPGRSGDPSVPPLPGDGSGAIPALLLALFGAATVTILTVGALARRTRRA